MLTREDFVTESVQQFLRDKLFNAHSYPESQIELLESFDPADFQSKPTPLDVNYIASGYDFDNGGEQAELGSTLKRRIYTIEFFVIGKTDTWAKNLAQAIKFSLEEEGDLIPLLDVEQSPGSRSQIDTLVVLASSADRQPIPDPAPWQRHVWTTTLKVEDTYNERFA